ncbi:serine hydrolase domain-containing protein [Streptomyces hoynatensis]|uniref:Class A beta-lactamase-related serine hydrolase n=1 Tax=Streptomyces hoynatensis TaxID=1141874 RepID=A0A3A9Z929_9ACTN|nr:serine hydrolase domain-containing protein [Streptomyces hoynatensis]RKN44840.1 class A beta-lactamase-related serine hydrolase [Streptomyces hoynatensis]
MTEAPSGRAARAAGVTRRRLLGGGAAALLSGAALAATTGALTWGSSRDERESGGTGGDPVAEYLSEAVPDGAGLTALAARGEEVVHCAGRGLSDREAGIAYGCGTVFDIGSLTKQFTAAAILRLEMARALSTDDPLAAHVAGLPADKRSLTLHQLLTHTAGLVDVLGDDDEVLSREDMLTAMGESELQSAPGAAYHYSNVGYSVLAAVIEKVSGAGYEEYLAHELFAPAGLSRTGYVLPRWERSGIAVEYDGAGTPVGRPNEHPWAEDGPYWNLRGNGGLLSTAPDMHRWHLALSGDGVLSAAAREKMFRPWVREDGGDTWYGYGWVIADWDGHRVAWHNGGNGLSYAECARRLDDGLLVFWATGAVEGDGEWNLEELDLTRGIAGSLRAGG